MPLAEKGIGENARIVVEGVVEPCYLMLGAKNMRTCETFSVELCAGG